MRLFVTTAFLIALIILCDKNIAQGALIKKDVSQHPIHITGGASTWMKDGMRIFSVGGAKIEQGDIQITADNAIFWFSEVKSTQFTEGSLDILCEGNVTLMQEDSFDKYEEVYLKLTTTSGVVFKPKVQSSEEEKISDIYTRGEEIRAKGMEEFASKHKLKDLYQDQTKQLASVDAEASGELIDITADDIDSWEEGDTRVIVAIGNVKIKKSGETLDADNAILYMDLEKDEKGESKQSYKEFYAEGNVTLTQGEDLIIADKVFDNVQERKALFINSTVTRVLKPPILKQTAPSFVVGEEMKQRDKGRYEVKNGNFSFCSYGHPHYRFKFKKFRITKAPKSLIGSTKNNVFYLGKVPIMYVPFSNFSMRKKKKRLAEWDTGTTDRYGKFIFTEWDVNGFAPEKIDPWGEIKLFLDYRELKGPGGGVEYEYEIGNSFGLLDAYFQQDDDETGIKGTEVDTTTRGHFLWRQRLMLSQALSKMFDDEFDTDDGETGADDDESGIFTKNGWIADMEISYVSDRTYLREFFQSQLKSEKGRDTSLYLRKVSDNRGLTFLAEHQLRTYDPLIDSRRLSRKGQSLPELQYNIIGEPLWDDILNLTSETELAYQNRMYDRISPKKAEQRFLSRGDLLTAERVFDRAPARFAPEETIRFDTNNRLNAPFRLLGQYFNPYIGIRFTGYSESVKVDPVTGRNEGEGAPRGRVAIPIGFKTTRSFARTYSIYNKLLNINRLRHTIIPELAFDSIPIVTQDPEDLNQFDGTDALDTYSSISFGLRSRLQTKRGKTGEEKTSVDIASFNTIAYFFPGNAGLNRKRDSYIEMDFSLRFSERLSFNSSGNEFNLDENRFDIINWGITHNHPKWGNISIQQRFAHDILNPVTFSYSRPIGNDKWSWGISQQYALGTGENPAETLFAGFSASRLFHDWIANVSISSLDFRDDNIFTITVVPRGILAIKAIQDIIQPYSTFSSADPFGGFSAVGERLGERLDD
ncbi:MAG: LPS-assembly protein LptD [Candidatus Scalindua arabica]|uniref:LPS-assembly protein LptD n=1 Tax=Candidatus Scalindua arabica TaxID=1127984 RepID=A0A941W484_9BACT|nr:LPS-assembly protein LptD [Candidatus Scalindua arabica]